MYEAAEQVERGVVDSKHVCLCLLHGSYAVIGGSRFFLWFMALLCDIWMVYGASSLADIGVEGVELLFPFLDNVEWCIGAWRGDVGLMTD